MGILKYLVNMAVDAAPHHPGFQTQALYILLNLAIPIMLGIVLAWITRFMEKGLLGLLGENR